MRKHLGTVLVVAGLVAVPALARAQAGAMPSKEFGVDIGAVYTSPSGGTSSFGIGIPFGDVRVGFVSASKMQFEARLAAAFASGGGTFITFDPGVNVLMKLGNGTGHHNMMGTYWTVGADAAITSIAPTGVPSTSGVVLSINGGIGTRMAWGSAAKRLEGFVRYSLKNTTLGVPNTLQIGARLGLSFWH